MELTITETTRLTTLESTIERGLQTFVEVGNALLEIRDGKLYRANCGTFEDYCRERWGFTRMRASQLIAAAEVVGNVNNCLQIPANEAQARAMSHLTPQLQRTVWPIVVDTAPNGKITANHIQRTVDEYERSLDAALADEHKSVCLECGQVYDGAGCPDCQPNLAVITPYYQGKQVTVYNCNFRNILPSINDGFFIFDPPYNIGFKYDVYQDNLPDEVYIEMLREFSRFSKVVVIQYPEEMQRLVVPALGPPDHSSVWCYNSNTSRRFRLINWYGLTPDYSRIKQPYKNPTDRRVAELIANGNVGTDLYEWWDDIQIVKNVSPEKTAHPCPVPEALIKRIIMLGADPGDVIIDPFAGSLTTLKAAQDLGYQAIGMELSESYIKSSLARLSQFNYLSLPQYQTG